MSCSCGQQIFNEIASGGLKANGTANISNFLEYGGPKCGGSATVSTNQTFDGFDSVYHLTEQGTGVTGEYRNSTGKAGGTASVIPFIPTRTDSRLFSYCQELDGNDFISFPMDEIPANGNFTVSVWGKRQSTFLQRVYFSRGKTDSINQKGWVLELGHNFDNQPYACLQVVNGNSWIRKTATASGKLGQGCWFHLACSFKSGQSLKLYVDGQLSATTVITETETPTSLESALGRRDISSYAQAQLCELRIYPEVLSAAWINEEFESMCRVETVTAETEESTTYS